MLQEGVVLGETKWKGGVMRGKDFYLREMAHGPSDRWAGMMFWGGAAGGRMPEHVMIDGWSDY